MTPCPHPGLQVGGRCYFCCKVAATNGHRSKLSVEQLGFVGFVDLPDRAEPDAWAPAAVHTHIDDKLAELAHLYDVMPGWLRLTRAIVEDE